MNALALRSAGIAVPYAAKMVRRYRNAVMNRAAYNAGRAARRYVTRRVARSIRNAAKKRYAAIRSNRPTKRSRVIGHKKGTGTTKRNVTQDRDVIARNTRQLYHHNVISIPKTTTNEIDSRQRDIVFLKGIKLCYELLNLSAEPMCVNLAYIAPKHDNDTDIAQEFFRGSGDTRALNFSTDLNSNDLHCRPINTDRWHILMHKRFKLDPRELSTSITSQRHASTRSSYTTINHYLKINRQIRFNDDTSVQARSKIYLVYWFDKFMTAGGSNVQSNLLNVQFRTTLFFKEST